MLTRKLSWVVAFHIVKYAHLRFMSHVGPSSQVAFSEHRTLCGPVRLNPGSQLYVVICCIFSFSGAHSAIHESLEYHSLQMSREYIQMHCTCSIQTVIVSVDTVANYDTTAYSI